MFFEIAMSREIHFHCTPDSRKAMVSYYTIPRLAASTANKKPSGRLFNLLKMDWKSNDLPQESTEAHFTRVMGIKKYVCSKIDS